MIERLHNTRINSVSFLFKVNARHSQGTVMRLIFVILVFLHALIYARPLEDDEIFADVEIVDHHPESSELRQGQKEEINEGEVGLDCGDYEKKLEECKGIVGCALSHVPCEAQKRQAQKACLKTVHLKYRTCLKGNKEMKKE